MTLPATLDRLSAFVPIWLKTRGAALIAVAALQLGILGVMLGDRIYLLKTGREIVLKTEPVDPRDLLKGDFARLGYDITTIPKEFTAGVSVKPGAPIFVTLDQNADGAWKVVKASAQYPESVPANQVVMRALMDDHRFWGSVAPRVRYGIERYYVPEGTGHDIEKTARERRLEVIVAVGPNGVAAIKGLSIDGKKVYDEPMF